MQEMTYSHLISQQRQYFASGKTLPLSFRIEQLKKLKSILQTNEKKMLDALYQDLRKAPMESIVSEFMIVIKELEFAIKNLKNWLAPKKVGTIFPILWPGSSQIHFDPYGNVLIISPWNYPLLLSLSPLIGAICAGNCVVIKPSEVASATQNMIVQLINDHFPTKYIAALRADPAQTDALLKEKFDYIFFTGSTSIGKIVMEAAAKHLTPVTLELGGKSPCIVDESADIDYAARRIIWGKFLNAGQTCIAPDYLYVARSCKDKLLNKLQQYIQHFYGENPEKNASYGRIINKKHFERIVKLMQTGTITFGGKTNVDDLYIAPTLITDLTWDDPIMQEEIFGPLLPIIFYDKFDEIIHHIKSHEKPLALYLFTKNKINENRILKNISFGNGCINDCVLQIANYHLPFGGVGASGIGHYHGKYSFETFSHQKSIYKKKFLIDFRLIYPPYSGEKLWWFRQLLKW